MRFATSPLSNCLLVTLICSMILSRPASGQQVAKPARSAQANEQGKPAQSAEKRLAVGDPINVDFPEVSPGEKLTLDQAISRADGRNLSLAAARIDIEYSRARLKRSWSTLLPTANGSLIVTYYDKTEKREFGGVEFETRPRENVQGGLQANLPLVSPQTWLGVRAEREGVAVAEQGFESARQQLLLATAESFYQALTARSLIRVQENLLRAALRHLEVARLRHINGVGSRLDVIRARSEVVRIRQELTTAHSSFDNARDVLGVLTGRGGLPIPEEGPPIAAPRGSDEQLERRGLDQRPDLKVREKNTRHQEKLLQVNWMKFLPTLNLSWHLTHQFTDLPSYPGSFGLPDPDRTRWYALLTLTVPLYDHTRYADLDSQRAMLSKAKIEADDAKQQAGLEIRTAKRDYLTSLSNLDTSLEQASLSREALLLAEKAYENGTGSSLDVTDASRTSRRDEMNLAIKRFEVQLAVLKLVSATGGDLLELTPRPQ